MLGTTFDYWVVEGGAKEMWEKLRLSSMLNWFYLEAWLRRETEFIHGLNWLVPEKKVQKLWAAWREGIFSPKDHSRQFPEEGRYVWTLHSGRVTDSMTSEIPAREKNDGVVMIARDWRRSCARMLRGAVFLISVNQWKQYTNWAKSIPSKVIWAVAVLASIILDVCKSDCSGMGRNETTNFTVVLSRWVSAVECAINLLLGVCLSSLLIAFTRVWQQGTTRLLPFFAKAILSLD